MVSKGAEAEPQQHMCVLGTHLVPDTKPYELHPIVLRLLWEHRLYCCVCACERERERERERKRERERDFKG